MHLNSFLLGFVVVIVLMLAIVFRAPSITGYVASETFSKSLDLRVDHSQRFYMESDKVLSLTALALGGTVDGKGLVNVYLSNPANSERLLVFSNKASTSSAMQFITGLSIVDVKLVPGESLDIIESLDDRFVTTSGSFVNECEETCLLDPSRFTGNKFVLDFITEPGTEISVTNIRYTVAQG